MNLLNKTVEIKSCVLNVIVMFGCSNKHDAGDSEKQTVFNNKSKEELIECHHQT